jgi:hypothetical protein
MRAKGRTPVIAVYTAIAGNYDTLRLDQEPAGAVWLAFVAEPTAVRPPWQPLRVYDGFTHPNLNAKTHKVLAHQWLPHAEISLWLDGNIALKRPVTELLPFLESADVVMFGHPKRQDLQAECRVSQRLAKYDPAVLAGQTAKYIDQRETGRGLPECGIILRRHTVAVERFNEAWWAEICRHSFQDQLSVMPAVHKTGMRLGYFPGSISDNRNDWFDYRPHG